MTECGNANVVRRPAADGVELIGRTGVVTGGGSGIGRARAVRLARAGAAVTVIDLDGDAAAATAATIGGFARAADLTDPRTVDEIDVVGDIVVNNAGFQHIAPLEEFPPRSSRRCCG
jgi:3-hydroxybutyrate dehydrogenase